MKKSHKSLFISLKSTKAFTTIELLVTLFIAAIFLVSGFQLYVAIIKDGDQTRAQSLAGNEAYNYLQKYKQYATNPCTVSTPLSASPKTVQSLVSVTVTVSITCPYGTDSSISKIKTDIYYNTPQKTVSNTTFTTPDGSYTPLICPTGFIVVPGSAVYGTSDFCVMKYEAKQVGATTVPTSIAAGLPWVNISQTDAITYSQTVSGCTGCHLITEAEWMTIARDVLMVPSNWSGNAVGSGYIYSGHNDSAPNNSIEASTDDNLGYANTGNTSGSNQRRTLTLTNGEVIWDLAGNVGELTTGIALSGQQPGLSGSPPFPLLIPWTSVGAPGSLPLPSVFPLGTGIANANTWDTTKGIGGLYSYPLDTATRSFNRGGYYTSSSYSGVLCLRIEYTPSFVYPSIGFRVAK